MKEEIGKALLVVFMEPDGGLRRSSTNGTTGTTYRSVYRCPVFLAPGAMNCAKEKAPSSFLRSTNWKTSEYCTARLI